MLASSPWGVFMNRGKRYVYVFVGDDRKQLHRVLLSAGLGIEVDHINGDGLDNRSANLRLCNRAQNAKNRRVNSNSKSGIKGVRFDESKRVWEARIRCDGRRISLGRFKNKDQAAEAYRSAAMRLHGAFARR